MEAERLSMSKKEQDRSEVIRLYVEGYIKQKEAAKRLAVSTRQIRNVAHAYRLHGAMDSFTGIGARRATARYGRRSNSLPCNGSEHSIGTLARLWRMTS